MDKISYTKHSMTSLQDCVCAEACSPMAVLHSTKQCPRLQSASFLQDLFLTLYVSASPNRDVCSSNALAIIPF